MHVLVVGRFQPPHLGHLHLLQHAKQLAGDDPLIVVLGSAQEENTPRNPLSSAEREALLRKIAPGIHTLPVADIHDDARYPGHVLDLVERTFGVRPTAFAGNDARTRDLFLGAGLMDAASGLKDRDCLEGRQLRERLAKNLDWASFVPEAIVPDLRLLQAAGRFR